MQEKSFLSNKGVIAGYLLLLIVAVLIGIGMAIVYSSGELLAMRISSFNDIWRRQLTFAGIGIIIIFMISMIDYHIYIKHSIIILSVSVALLVFLLVTKINDLPYFYIARRLYFGSFSFQASDFAKYALVFYFSKFISEKQVDIKHLYKSYFPMLILLMSVMILVALEPDFNKASLIGVTGFTLMFIGGVSMRYLITTFSLLIPVAGVFISMAPYRLAQILRYFNADKNELSFQVKQALVALHAGGLFGLGFGAIRKKEFFVPNSYNDFAFAVIGEEYGFVGAFFVILLFAGFFLAGITIAKNAADNYGKFMAIGITTAICLFAFTHIGIVCKLLPTAGVELPFISYGGSYLLFNCLGTGILYNISRHKGDNTIPD